MLVSHIGVVPHAGTWIEMKKELEDALGTVSFPTRERGLKYHKRTGLSLPLVVPHAGTWIEIRCTGNQGLPLFRRSPRGNVD